MAVIASVSPRGPPTRKRSVPRVRSTEHGLGQLDPFVGEAEALALAKSHQGPIDLLLTDVVMPQMLGHEVAQRFVELRPGAKVLYMSGYAQPSVDAR